jgi:hypothetical protein
MLVTVYHEKNFPNRIIGITPYSSASSPCFIPGIDIKLKVIADHEKSIVADPTSWIWTPHNGIAPAPVIDTDLEKEKYKMLSRKLKLVERLWVMALILDKSVYKNMLGTQTHEEIMSWELDNNIQDEHYSLTNYMASKMNTDSNTYSTIYKINKDTYYTKVKELYVSILKIQDMIMESDNPDEVYKTEASRLVSQPKK